MSKNIYRGERDSVTACSRTFTECTTRPCRIQSPNFPGMYPRNTTCQYRVHVRQNDVPRNLYPLVIIRQPDSSKVSVRAERVEKYGLQDTSLGLFSDCDSVGDRVNVYDGKRTNDPLLISFCRGSAIPPVISSGPDLLLVFSTSPFATPAITAATANGFELDVEIKLVPKDSILYSPQKRGGRDGQQCRFDISSRDRARGVVKNVVHALPGNSSCQYHFLGDPGEVVWLTFQKFEVVHQKKDIYRSASCLNRLELFDPARKKRTTERIGEFCEHSPPKLCDHFYLQDQQSAVLLYSSGNKNGRSSSATVAPFRACVGANESYISQGSELTLIESIGESTAVTSLNFVISYEFVNTVQDGQPALVSLSDLPPAQEPRQEIRFLQAAGTDRSLSRPDTKWNCNRVFNSASYSRMSSNHPADSLNRFSSPQNVFLYGRGGRRDLHCSYTFNGRPGERVQLEITHLSLGKQPERRKKGGKKKGPKCLTKPHPDLEGHFICATKGTKYDSEYTEAQLWIAELPDGSTPLRQHCLCQHIEGGNRRQGNAVFLSNTSSLRVEFIVRNMSPDDDYETYSMTGRFSFVHEPRCHLRKLAMGAGGTITLKTSSYCTEQPWVIEPSQEGKFIFLKVPGKTIYSGENSVEVFTNMSRTSLSGECETRNRIMIYSGDHLTIICPSEMSQQAVELFSQGWDDAKFPPPQKSHLFSDAKTRTAADNGQSKSSMVVKFIGVEPSRSYDGYILHWLEISPTPEPNALSVFDQGGENSNNDLLAASSCAYACPELSGCIRSELWCDGIVHCPSGFDETEENCAHVFVPILYMYGVSALVLVVLVIIAILIVQRLRSRHTSTSGSLSASATVISGSNGLVYGHADDSITNLAKLPSHHHSHNTLPLNGSATSATLMVSSVDLMSHEDDFS